MGSFTVGIFFVNIPSLVIEIKFSKLRCIRCAVKLNKFHVISLLGDFRNNLLRDFVAWSR